MIKKDRRRFFRKKGVIDYTILVLITVLAAFAIILVMTFKVFDSVDPDFDICQQSVIARDTFSWGPSEAGREYIPLNCRTQKLCLRTSKSEDCLGGGIVSTQDNKVKNIEISNKPQNSKGEIISEIADSMYRCHTMMGEGELNFMPHEFKEQNYCIVCTKIAVDDKYKSTQKVPTITQGEIFEYLSEREDNIEVSYLKRIYHVDDPAELKRYFDENGEKIVDDNNYEVNEMNSNIDFNKQTYAIIIQQIPEGDATEKFAGLFSGGLTTFSIIGIAAKTVGIAFLGVSGIGFAVVGGVIVGTYVYTQSGVNEQYQYAAPAVVPYNAQTLKALKCTDLEGAA